MFHAAITHMLPRCSKLDSQNLVGHWQAGCISSLLTTNLRSLEYAQTHTRSNLAAPEFKQTQRPVLSTFPLLSHPTTTPKIHLQGSSQHAPRHRFYPTATHRLGPWHYGNCTCRSLVASSRYALVILRANCRKMPREHGYRTQHQSCSGVQIDAETNKTNRKQNRKTVLQQPSPLPVGDHISENA